MLNLAGAFLTLLALGGIGDWTGRQFIGLFGLLEIATGIIFVIGPNIWRLPVATAELEHRTRVEVAASTILIPHWAGGVKCLAGLAMVTWTAMSEGLAWASAGAVLLIADVVVVGVAISLVGARLGCARPETDVFQVSIARPHRKRRELPALSITASMVQFLLNVLTFPAVKLLPPSDFYAPHIQPSGSLLLVLSLVAVSLGAIALGLWANRLAWKAAAPQQREAERAFSEQ